MSLLLDLTGGAASYTLIADSGTYSVTGQPATLTASHVLNASPVTYSVTGINASLVANYVLNANAGSYGITGSNASLISARSLSTDAGSYFVTGVDATLTYVPSGVNYTLIADPGDYAITGNDAYLFYQQSSQDTFIGGYEHHPYKYKKRIDWNEIEEEIRKELKRTLDPEEIDKVVEVIQSAVEEKPKNIEVFLKQSLNIEHIAYRVKYLELTLEAIEIKTRQKRDDEIMLLLLH